MKRLFYVLGIVAVLFIFPATSFAEEISAFSATISVQADASIKVVESINYDFGAIARHGIYRDIPYKYQARGGNFNLQISGISVTDETGAPYIFTVTNSGNNKQIKIGDSSVTITGRHSYVIGYTVSRAINYFKDYDELYWNVTGNGWQVGMQNISAQVSLPSGGQVSQTACFSGVVGAVTPCESASSVGSPSVIFKQPSLNPAEGFTIVIGFPKGLVNQPSAWQNFLAILNDNWGLGLPVLVFLLMLLIWSKKGRDPGGFKTIVAQYEPPANVTPTEAGTIVDESAANRDITAEIINLAVHGYLKITQLKEKVLLLFNSTDYSLDLLKSPGSLPNKFEQTMVKALFGEGGSVKFSSLKNTFYQDLADIRKQVYQSVVDKGFFAEKPNVVRAWYLAGAVCLGFFGIFIGSVTQNFYTAIGFIISAVIVAIFAYFMPKATAKGAEMKAYILGLKLYMNVAEKDRLKFFNAPEKTPEHFEKLLPYALALGVETSWAKQFEGIYKTPPAWYSGSPGGAFNALYFVGMMHSFNQTAGQTFSSRPSSAAGGGSGFGGSGFSGGGFGGGGGGSW